MRGAGRFLLLSLAVLIFSAGLVTGISLKPGSQSGSSGFSDVISRLTGSGTDFSMLERVWNSIHSDYVETNIDDQALLDGAIAGMVGALGDPYSAYLTPAEAQEFEDDIDGVFEGVGMEVGFKNEALTVVAPLASSPAEQAGLRAGDTILQIDDRDAADLSLTEAVQLIRGPAGTTVRLIVSRTDSSEPLTFTVTRSTITIEPVTHEVIERDGSRYGYLQVSNFNDQTDTLFRRYARELLAQNVSGFVIDLRNNPGGLLDQSVRIASAFIPNGVIVAEVNRLGQRQELRALGNAFLQDERAVVLINGGSASASEIVAGALHDAADIVLIGETTFGKGTVQDYRQLSNGASLKLTVAKWLTPGGQSITDGGIEPDIPVTLTADDISADRDPQLDRALEELRP